LLKPVSIVTVLPIMNLKEGYACDMKRQLRHNSKIEKGFPLASYYISYRIFSVGFEWIVSLMCYAMLVETQNYSN